MKQIANITPNGISYLDDEGNPQFLNFENCYQNFLMETQKQMGSRYTDKVKEFYKTWKSVGVRHPFDKPPVIVFFTTPPTEFEFPTSEKLGEVEYIIRKFGYRTTDGE
jgi:lipopolysaccharide biosynthesis glycosyltransferase